jgi:septal ring factor EnvC (AmiA/AmiB activator)
LTLPPLTTVLASTQDVKETIRKRIKSIKADLEQVEEQVEKVHARWQAAVARREARGGPDRLGKAIREYQRYGLALPFKARVRQVCCQRGQNQACTYLSLSL